MIEVIILIMDIEAAEQIDMLEKYLNDRWSIAACAPYPPAEGRCHLAYTLTRRKPGT